MNINNIEMRILIKGRPITEYAHQGQLFVEGRDRSKFEIELVNRNAFSVEAIVSVEGLSVIDGKDAGPDSSGYLLRANETLRIPGWKLDDKAVAAFEFSVSGKGGTYVEQTTGSSRNSGVIGVMAYREKPKVFQGYTTLGCLGQPYNGLVSGSGVTTGFAMPTATTICTDFASQTGRQWLAKSTMTSTFRDASSWETFGADSSAPTLSVTCNANTSSIMSNACSADSVSSAAVQAQAMAAQVNNLGTAFGERQDFATSEVTFERGDLLSLGVIFYDDQRGLKARGIVLERRQRQTWNEPNAFPGLSTGCTPPRGWKG